MKILRKFRALFRKEKLDRDMAEEMRFHLNQRASENIEDGLSPEDARCAAQRKFDNVGLIQETARDERGCVWLEQLMQDIRFAARTLCKRPGFTLVAVLTLALAIGANTTMFSVVTAVLLRPLPLPHGEQVVALTGRGLAEFSGGDFSDLRSSSSFSQFGAYASASFNISGLGEPERVMAARVSVGFLSALGLQPWRGRNFSAAEDRDGGEKVVVLSHSFWQRKFGGDDAVGRTLDLDGQSHTVIGVLPPGIDFPPGAEVLLPLALRPTALTDYGGFFLKFIARLAPGVTRAAANTEVRARLKRTGEDGQISDLRQKWIVDVVSLQESRISDVRKMLWVLMGAVGFVVLIACGNLANLLLASATRRHKEIAVRLSLGAGRRRVVRQFLTESLLLAFLGGVAGVVLAGASCSLINEWLPAKVPHVGAIGLDGTVLAFTALVTLTAGVLFGILPALRASQTALTDALKSGGSGAAGGTGRQRVRGLLVISQVALTVVLLAGAGLLLKSFARLQEESVGFVPERLLTARLPLVGPRYADRPSHVRFAQRVLDEIRRQPGLQDVGGTSHLPFASGNQNYLFLREGQEKASPGTAVGFRGVTPDYFRVLGLTLLQGRGITAADDERGPKVVVINDVMAKRFWPDENPIGRRIRETSNFKEWREIVGVVSSVRHRAKSAPPAPEMFVPWDQSPGTALNLIVRTAMEPELFAGALRRAVASVDPELPIFELRTMEARIADSVAEPRFRTALLTTFAVLALAMAAVGLYGVIALSTSQRSQEFGVRMALGARSSDVVGMVLAQGARLTAIGVGVGLAGAFALTRLLASLLYEVGATDPLTFSTVPLLLMAVTLLACWLPARRAAKVDPMVALRCD